jgi:hypothetical protein
VNRYPTSVLQNCLHWWSFYLRHEQVNSIPYKLACSSDLYRSMLTDRLDLCKMKVKGDYYAIFLNAFQLNIMPVKMASFLQRLGITQYDKHKSQSYHYANTQTMVLKKIIRGLKKFFSKILLFMWDKKKITQKTKHISKKSDTYFL